MDEIFQALGLESIGTSEEKRSRLWLVVGLRTVAAY
jgi:hypothetical protein